MAVSEREQAIVLANKILDRPSHDPDDDLAVLSRQFLRALEKPVAPEMSLVHALHILIGVHTKDDPEISFAVIMGALPHEFTGPSYDGHASYIEAWRMVRRALGMPS